jgi:glycosyltransferase involved in cell wall biosynthesis
VKIAFLTPYVAWPLDHGGRIRTHHLLRAVAASHDVLNLAVARTPGERGDAEALATIGIRVRPGLLRAPDMRLPGNRLRKWMSVAAGRSSLPGRWWSREFAALVAEEASRERFDLAVVDTPWMDAYRAALGPLPYVACAQNVEADVLLEAARAESGLARAVNERDARLFLRREAAFLAGAAAAVAVSGEDAARIRELAPAVRVAVVENGVDVDRLAVLPPAGPDGPLLFVGSFDYPANVDAARFLATSVLPAVRARVGPTTAILAGRAPPPEVHALGAVAGIEVTGTVADVVPHYARASVVVVPIRTGGGSRLKILEALALGRPVVTTTAGARGLDVRPGVHVLVADTPEAFAAALLKLRAEPELPPRLVRAGRAFVEERHAWPSIERRFAELIASLVRRAP